MNELFATTALHGKIWIKEDPWRLIMRGQNLDSKLTNIENLVLRPSPMPFGFISFKPEGPKNSF